MKPPTDDEMQYVSASSVGPIVSVVDRPASTSFSSVIVMPWYPDVAAALSESPAAPLFSPAYVSTAVIAVRTLACAADLLARSRKPRYDGTAIASRIPMMMITTRSSMRVKPPSRSDRVTRCVSLAIIDEFLLRRGIDVRRAQAVYRRLD